MATSKPTIDKVWANSAPVGDLEEPDTPKWASGWLFGEKPPHKWMNWLQWLFSKVFVHLNERGVLEHDLTTTYLKGAFVWKGNKIFQARVENTNQDTALATFWQEQSLPDMPTSGDGFILYYSGSKLFWKDHQDLDYGNYQGRVAGDKKPLVILNDNTLGNDPIATEINIGELALNFKDKALFTKTPEGVVIQLGGSVSIVDFEYTATEGQDTFSPIAGYLVGQIEVFMGGRKLGKTEYVANNAVDVILNEPAKAGDFIVITVWGAFTVADAYTQAQVDALLLSKVPKTQTVIDYEAINGIIPEDGAVYTDPLAVPATPNGAKIYPDGRIEGSTTHGPYVRLPSGDMECWYIDENVLTTSTLLASPIHSSAFITWTYPVVFIAKPFTVASPHNRLVGNIWVGRQGDDTTTQSQTHALFSYSVTSSAKLQFHAKGRWK